MNLFGTIGRSNFTDLLADPMGCDVIAIACEPGNGTLLPGQIMYRKGDMYAPATATEIGMSYSLTVLGEAVDTDAEATIAENAVAFRAAHLIAGKVLVKGGTLTAAQALILRMQGIVLDQLMELAPEIDNGKYAVTYKANNETTEADVVAYKDAGTAYTIAANTFTAPSSKAFSKWNTKADGSGTDYAAAASYTTDADLTLYAIWA